MNWNDKTIIPESSIPSGGDVGMVIAEKEKDLADASNTDATLTKSPEETGIVALRKSIDELYAEATDETKWPKGRKRTQTWGVHQGGMIAAYMKVLQRFDHFSPTEDDKPDWSEIGRLNMIEQAAKKMVAYIDQNWPGKRSERIPVQELRHALLPVSEHGKPSVDGVLAKPDSVSSSLPKQMTEEKAETASPETPTTNTEAISKDLRDAQGAITKSLGIYERFRAGEFSDEMMQAVVKPLILLHWPSVRDYLIEKDKEACK